jgi:cytosine/adenosine deaminase-related metal-dependent hydrolase
MVAERTTMLTNIRALMPMTGTRDAPDPLLRDAAVLLRGPEITWVGTSGEAQKFEADEVIDLRDHIALPGLVNTHHHLYQTLTRCIAQDAGLFDWLKTLYPIWLRLTPEAVYTSAQVGLAELMLSGCTTASDHLYIYPNHSRVDDEIRAAQEIGIRFHATRGSMSLGESRGGLPPDAATENEDWILEDSARAIERFHDSQRFAMTRVALAPCSPFSVTPDLMRESARLARHHGVMLHTHLAETHDEDQFCLQAFGKRPLEYAESLEWLGSDVWFAHGVHFSREDAHTLGRCGCGVAHCPSSNMRLASGIAPVRTLLEAGVKVGLGVDGSASNDGNHLLNEARQAMLISRLASPNAHLRALDALWIATRGGASTLGRDDIGQIAPGFAADLIAVNMNRLEYAGAQHDPLAALVFCAPRGVDFSMVSGRVVLQHGQLTTLELPGVIERHNRISRAMIEG